MKANSNSKKLLIILAMVILVIAVSQYFIRPKFTQINSLRTDVNSEADLILTMYNECQNYDENLKLLNEKKDNASVKLEKYFVNQRQEVFIGNLKSISKQANVDLQEINSENMDVCIPNNKIYNCEDIYSDYDFDKKNYENFYDISESDIPLALSMSINVKLNGRYSNVMKFCELCDETYTNLYINSIDISTEEGTHRINDNDECEAEIGIKYVTLYFLNDITDKTDEFTIEKHFELPEDIKDGSIKNIYSLKQYVD